LDYNIILAKEKNAKFWWIIKRYNSLMKSAIEGPDCTNPNNCNGDCCSIKINVPKVLAKEYISQGFASKLDFIRSDVFSFQLRFDNNSVKCFLFDKKLNGCLVHNSGIKPPQCWIYPTNFSNTKQKEIKCKKLLGWKIINTEKAGEAEKLLEKYLFLCQLEAKKEIKNVKNRLGFINSKNSSEKVFNLTESIKSVAPSNLGGFKDSWDNFQILPAEGLSLQMKKFCLKYNKKCKYLPDSFFECNSICDNVSDNLIKFLDNYIYQFIDDHGPDSNGEYPLFKLFKYAKQMNCIE